MTNAACIYKGTVNDESVLFLCLTNNFAIGCDNSATYNTICLLFIGCLREPLKCQGTLSFYNIVNFLQTCYFIQITCTLYIHKCLESHDWFLLQLIFLHLDPSPLATHILNNPPPNNPSYKPPFYIAY